MRTDDMRFGFAVVVGVAAAILGLLMINYFIAQIGSDAPELALPYNLLRVGAAAIFGLASAALVMEKS